MRGGGGKCGWGGGDEGHISLLFMISKHLLNNSLFCLLYCLSFFNFLLLFFWTFRYLWMSSSLLFSVSFCWVVGGGGVVWVRGGDEGSYVRPNVILHLTFAKIQKQKCAKKSAKFYNNKNLLKMFGGRKSTKRCNKKSANSLNTIEFFI